MSVRGKSLVAFVPGREARSANWVIAPPIKIPPRDFSESVQARRQVQHWTDIASQAD